MSERSDGRVVVVTGASSGIGRATAHLLAERGDRLVLASRSAPALADVVEECRARGAVSVEARSVDVVDEAAVGELVDWVVERHGRVDAWVHAAAVMAYGRFTETPTQVWRQVVETVLFGTVNSARAVLPVMQRQKSGVLVVVGSVLGQITVPYASSYVTAKWGLRGFVRTLQAELRDAPGVQVVWISPGSVDTPVYAQGANYLGTVTRPPPPVDPPERVARAIVRALDRPPRERSVGLANGLMRLAFTALPSVWDRLVMPVMHKVGLTDERIPPNDGNVFVPVASGEHVHGGWNGLLGRRASGPSVDDRRERLDGESRGQGPGPGGDLHRLQEGGEHVARADREVPRVAGVAQGRSEDERW